VYSPSTILASGNAASTVGASDSTRRAGADSSAAGADSSSATAALGSSPSQVKSVDFLQSIQLVVNPVRQPNQMYYSGKTFTYRLDRTTVTVGAPRMLVISTSPASAGGSSWASVAVGSSATTTAGSVLPLATGGWRVSCATSSSTVGARLRLAPAGSPTVSQSPSPPVLRGQKAESPASNGISLSAHTTSRHKYSTTPLKEAYLFGRGLRDLKLLGHALAGHVARLPWRLVGGS
jgi:hypothetical protein